MSVYISSTGDSWTVRTSNVIREAVLTIKTVASNSGNCFYTAALLKDEDAFADEIRLYGSLASA